MTVRCALLLRAVNVGGANRVPMAQLRALLAERTDLTGVSTYIASGNIICDLVGDGDGLRARVRALIREQFDVDTPVILRTHHELAAAVAANPFPDAPLERMLHVMFLEGDPAADALTVLEGRRRPGERLALRDRELWIDYGAGGVASTKLTTTLLERALGVTGTARNLSTVRKLLALTAAGGADE